MPLPYALSRRCLFALDPEVAHHLTLASLELVQNTPLICAVAQPRVNDPVTVAGLRFPNRIGLAAGLDKNGRCIDGLSAMGFGFIEVGTVTPLPQPGNPKPRIFRLPQAQAMINRLGFNNEGLTACLQHVQKSRFRSQGGILGLNIGKNASTPIERSVDDYLLGLQGVYPHADYIAVNISSPNTQNLRSLQHDAALNDLLAALHHKRLALAQTHGRSVPLFVKIAPDLDDVQLQMIATTLQTQHMDGLIATNTTLSREAVAHLPHSSEAGGLSGQPVLEASNRVIRQMRTYLGPHFPIMGVGGVMSAADAQSKIAAGADVVQIYTGLIYQGPALVREAAAAIKAQRY